MSKNEKSGSVVKFFCCAPDGVRPLSADEIMHLFEVWATNVEKTDVAAGPQIREFGDQFREWARIAEPGWQFHVPALSLAMVRLATGAPVCGAMRQEPELKIATG